MPTQLTERSGSLTHQWDHDLLPKTNILVGKRGQVQEDQESSEPHEVAPNSYASGPHDQDVRRVNYVLDFGDLWSCWGREASWNTNSDL